MKKSRIPFFRMSLTLLFFLPIFPTLGAPSIVSGFLNDNYTGSTDNGINGRYIGADDFLTFGLFMEAKQGDLDLALLYQIITSRHFHYRWDLISTYCSYSFFLENLSLTPNAGILLKGDFGGETIQNDFHEAKELPLVYEDYTESSIAPFVGINTAYQIDSLLLNNDRLKASLEIEIPFGIKPIHTLLSIDYLIDLSFCNLEFLGGYKLYLSEIENYSEMVRSGFIFGTQGIIFLWKNFTLNAGCYFFPVKNLENDPIYMDKDHNYSPQFWVTIGYNGQDFSILDIINN